jgi:repressor LexA
MQTLTKRQKEILDFVRDFLKEYGYAPSFNEIMEKCELSARSTVHEHLTSLVSKGYLKRDKRKERGLCLPEKRKEYLELPLLGSIACGEPLEAIQESGQTVKVARESSLKGNLYALRAKGNSMVGEGIFDGDIIIIRKQEVADNGNTVVGVIDDNEATLKKYYQEKDSIRLQPANPEFKPMYRKYVEIRGVVVKIIRNLS